MTETSTQKIQEIATQALTDNDQATYYEAARELAAVADYADHYRKLTRRTLDDPAPRHR